MFHIVFYPCRGFSINFPNFKSVRVSYVKDAVVFSAENGSFV